MPIKHIIGTGIAMSLAFTVAMEFELNKINKIDPMKSRNLQFSRIEDHNTYQETDQLYDPLRGVLLHSNHVPQHYEMIEPAAMRSRVTHDYTYLNPEQVDHMRRQILIPINQPLAETHDFSKVSGKQFMVVDAHHQVVGNPISQSEMEYLRKQGPKEERVIYDLRDQRISEPTPTRVAQSTYRPPPVHDQQLKDRYKYNLYSMIDEPANAIKEGGSCICPGNEIIASRNNTQSLGWFH